MGDSRKEIWTNKAVNHIGSENNYATAMHGIVFGAGDNDPGQGPTRIVALNATNGQLMWDYMPNTCLWNFAPQSMSDGTILVMDHSGGVCRLGIHDGKLLWRTPPPPGSQSSF